MYAEAELSEGRVVARAWVSLIVGVGLVFGTIAALAWAWPYANTGHSLYLFEQEHPSEVVPGSARQGTGLLGLDVVHLDDGRVIEAHRQGEPRVQYPRPEFVVGEHGARLADEPPSDGAWRPFALRALAGLLVGIAAAVAAIRPLRRASGLPVMLGDLVFGQRDPDSRAVTWLPGSGAHGSGGGQVPPYVPYNPDWDPKKRIR